MRALKLIGKIALMPAIIVLIVVLGIAWLVVKILVGIYSVCRAFFAFGMGLLIIGTIVCYQDYVQVAFLLALLGISLVILFAGTAIEVLLESACRGVAGKLMLR